MHAHTLAKATLRSVQQQGVSSSASSSSTSSNSSSIDQQLFVSSSKIRDSSSPGIDSMAVSRMQTKKYSPPTSKTSCLCAPTNHAGSFRCRFHRSIAKQSIISCYRVPLSATTNSCSSVSTTGRPPLSPPSTTKSSQVMMIAEKLNTRRVFSTPRSCNKAVRSFQTRPSRLSRMIVAASSSSVDANLPSVADQDSGTAIVE